MWVLSDVGAFTPLFSITVEHEFYRQHQCPGLRFVPQGETEHLIQNTGLVFKQTGSGMIMLYESSRLELIQQRLRDDGKSVCFDFKVYSSDPHFRGVTEPFTRELDNIPFFSNQGLRSTHNDITRLHNTVYVSAKNLVAVDSQEGHGCFENKDKSSLSLVCGIHLTALAGKNGLFDQKLFVQAKNYSIRFKAKSRIWKYYLLGNAASKAVCITDSENKFPFDAVGKEVLAGGDEASTFVSKKTIPLRQRYGFNLQLKENVNGGKILIKRLPLPALGEIGYALVEGEKVVVSEIYVNS